MGWRQNQFPKTLPWPYRFTEGCVRKRRVVMWMKPGKRYLKHWWVRRWKACLGCAENSRPCCWTARPLLIRPLLLDSWCQADLWAQPQGRAASIQQEPSLCPRARLKGCSSESGTTSHYPALLGYKPDMHGDQSSLLCLFSPGQKPHIL